MQLQVSADGILLGTSSQVMSETRYEVGQYSSSDPLRWDSWGTFADAQLAIRTANRLETSLRKRGIWKTVSCVRIGGGTIFDLDFSFPRFCGRLAYRRLVRQINWLGTQETSNAER